MLASILLPFALFSLTTLAQDTNATCYWPNGSEAPPSKLLPCKTSAGNDGFVACCPPSTASDLFPLDYPICTENGLCKAGNSDYIARGGCTDKQWSSLSCPSYCPSKTQTGMAGITNCDGRSPWYCCNDAHDLGACNCSPPNGTAFMLDSTTGKSFKDFMSGGSMTLGADGNGAGGAQPSGSGSGSGSGSASGAASASASASGSDAASGSMTASASASNVTGMASNMTMSAGGNGTTTNAGAQTTNGAKSTGGNAMVTVTSQASNSAVPSTAAAVPAMVPTGVAGVALGLLAFMM